MRDVFEKSLFENPDDLATYHAYADWLIEQNDPRGEFVHLQLQIEQSVDRQERTELRKRSRKLQVEHERVWLGGLSKLLLGKGSEEFHYSFARGWLHSLSIRNLRVTTAETVGRAAAAMLLRELKIGEIQREPPERRKGRSLPQNETYLGLYPLARSSLLKNLSSLQIGEIPLDTQEDETATFAETDAEPLLEILDQNPRLEKLILHIPSLPWHRLFLDRELPHLRELTLCGGLDHGIDALTIDGGFGAIQKLTLIQRPVRAINSQSLRAERITPLFRGNFVPQLTELSIRRFFEGDQLCKVLAESGVMKQLQSLSLTMGEITDEGAKLLLSSPDFAHLKNLELTRNQIENDLIKEILKIHPKADLLPQYQPGSYPEGFYQDEDDDEDLDYDQEWE